MLIGRSALGLAIRLANPPDADIAKLYRGLVTDLVTRGTYYMWKVPYIERVGYVADYETVFGLRNGGGWCDHYATATSHFAALALGALTTDYGELGITDHEMSAVIILPSVFGRVETASSDAEGVPDAGPINLQHDVDGDNTTDAGIILANTDPQDFTLRYMEEVLQYVGLKMYAPDTLVASESNGWSKYYSSSFFYFMGFTDYTKNLPSWLVPPWYPILRGVFDRVTELPGLEAVEKAVEMKRVAYSLGIVRDKLNATPVSAIEAPSYRLALGSVVDGIPAVDTGLKTTPIKLFEILYNAAITVLKPSV